ncbi:hypothetical protein ACOACO_17495 [Nocardioides sp. CPCC 205120]|uniref:hypothetical protein n=1 Tax=Nocardioides sp. CPCC 205120 TaxID=3406462 RepID=UPI003B50E2BE
MTASERSTADRRTYDAELASESASSTSTQEAHELARDLHREAAKWQLRVGNDARAELHEITARVHGQVATRLEEADGEAPEPQG